MSRTVRLVTPIAKTARVKQVEGMFDVPTAARSTVEIAIPDELEAVARGSTTQDWNVGLIVGPSGSGKSSVARDLWPEYSGDGFDWPADRAIVDGFDAGIRETVQLLTSVGFGSPPSWLRPYRALSTGEQFRADLARALAGPDDPIVYDEFTSAVDRRVAQIGSHAVQKAVRRRKQRFVAVTCHHDVVEWLQPDWVFRPDSTDFEWRRLQPHPRLEFDVFPVHHSAWATFRHHHYLSATLHRAARCFVAEHDGQPVAFASYLHFAHPHAKRLKMFHRIVVLPDYQGIGLGGRLTEHVAQQLAGDGWSAHITTGHPAFVAFMRRSPRWRELTRGRNAPARSATSLFRAKHTDPRRLATRSFAYVPH